MAATGFGILDGDVALAVLLTGVANQESVILSSTDSNVCRLINRRHSNLAPLNPIGLREASYLHQNTYRKLWILYRITVNCKPYKKQSSEIHHVPTWKVLIGGHQPFPLLLSGFIIRLPCNL